MDTASGILQAYREWKNVWQNAWRSVSVCRFKCAKMICASCVPKIANKMKDLFNKVKDA
jgi:hypothetical protein